MLAVKAGIHKMLVRKANIKEPNQTASSGSGSALFVCAFWQATSVQNFVTFTKYILCTINLANVLYG